MLAFKTIAYYLVRLKLCLIREIVQISKLAAKIDIPTDKL